MSCSRSVIGLVLVAFKARQQVEVIVFPDLLDSRWASRVHSPFHRFKRHAILVGRSNSRRGHRASSSSSSYSTSSAAAAAAAADGLHRPVLYTYVVDAH